MQLLIIKNKNGETVKIVDLENKIERETANGK